MRIGEVAAAVGTTARTIRYYEEIGLLGRDAQRESGKHREYSQGDVDRLKDILRMRDLLGVSLDELKELVEAEQARAVLRDEWFHDDPDQRRQAEMLTQALSLVERQLQLVRGRAAEISQLEASLDERREAIVERAAELAAVKK